MQNKNPLLIKDEAGQVRKTTFDLPNTKHSYGKKVQQDPQPIKHVMNSWQTGTISKEQQSKQKDFKKLNKMSIQNNITTAKEQKEFRSTQDVKVPIKKGQKVIKILIPEEQFTYGVPNRPSTPVKLVMGNCYALQAERKKQLQYMEATQKSQTIASKKPVAGKTKSQLLRQQKAQKQKQYINKSNIDPQFKLNKFSNTSQKIDTQIRPFKGTQTLQVSQ